MVTYAKYLKDSGMDEQLVMDALMCKGLSLNNAMTIVIHIF